MQSLSWSLLDCAPSATVTQLFVRRMLHFPTPSSSTSSSSTTTMTTLDEVEGLMRDMRASWDNAKTRNLWQVLQNHREMMLSGIRWVEMVILTTKYLQEPIPRPRSLTKWVRSFITAHMDCHLKQRHRDRLNNAIVCGILFYRLPQNFTQLEKFVPVGRKCSNLASLHDAWRLFSSGQSSRSDSQSPSPVVAVVPSSSSPSPGPTPRAVAVSSSSLSGPTVGAPQAVAVSSSPSPSPTVGAPQTVEVSSSLVDYLCGDEIKAYDERAMFRVGVALYNPSSPTYLSMCRLIEWCYNNPTKVDAFLAGHRSVSVFQ
jgi:hypothetical protein